MIASVIEARLWRPAVAWRNELRGSKPTKVPYAPDGKKGIGIQLGDLGADTHLCGIDLDSCIADDGALASWAAEIVSAVPTYTERSPSGRGLKIFFYMTREDVRPFLDRIGVPPNAWGTRHGVPGQDGRDHGPAIEVYLAGRYFTVTEDVWPGTPDTLDTLDAATLGRLAKLIPPAGSTRSKARNDADNSRSAIAFRMGLAMRLAGRTFEEFARQSE